MRTTQSTPHPRHETTEPEGTPLLLSVPEAAHLLGIGVTFAWELVHEGTIPSIKLGRRVLVPRSSLEQLTAIHRSDESA